MHWTFKRNTWDSSSPCLTQPPSPLAFTVRCYGNFSSQHWELLLLGVGRCGGWEASAAEIALLIFNHHTWVREQLIAHFHPLSVSMWLLFYILSYRKILFSQILGGSQWWLFYSIIIILMCLWEDASTAFTYFTILTESPLGESLKIKIFVLFE